jgi:tetratricopeptide (TPR) repeat protein
MKTTITMILAGALSIAGIKAQTIQEGMNHLYADRDKSAKETFQKLVATNPNNLDAIYWLGQADLSMEDTRGARDLYEKTLQSNGNAPLIMVGLGHVELISGNKDKARQLFESAITLSTGKKGIDAAVLNAIGRANVDAKEGDIAYAIDKLRKASDADPKNPDILLNLGDAYRKAHEGGQAITTYEKADQLNPAFARADYRSAKLYETQKNWEVYENYLNKSIQKDPRFAPAYYELYYYYLGKLDFNTAQDFANKFIANTEQDPQNDYLRIQTLWAQKKYDDAIAGAKNLVSTVGVQTKPRVYKLLALSYVGKGDTASAKQYIDEYFAKAKDEEVTPNDLILRGKIYGTVNGNDDIVYDSYVRAAQIDSVYDTKMSTLQEGIDYFKGKGSKIKEAQMRMVYSANRKTPNLQDPLFTGITFYQGQDYRRADSLFIVYKTSFPDSVYGHYYHARSNLGLDTTLSQEPYLSNMIDGFRRTIELAANNRDKYKGQAIASSSFLAAIYNNTKKNKDSAIYYLDKGLEFDPSNAALLSFKKQLNETPVRPPVKTTPVKSTTTKPKSNTSVKPPASKPKKSVAKS